ncbi:hypothetical protein HDZ31DRAFT_78284, partial [Schizophyllum fasciatum]
RTKLTRSINKLNEVQAHYTPDALPRIAAWKALSSSADAAIEETPLFPPSSLTSAERRRCFHGVAETESRLLTYKNINVRNQGPNTRAQAALAKNMDKIKRQAHKYCAAHAALVSLADEDAMQVSWHALDVNKDVRCMEDGDDGHQRGRKRANGDADAQGVPSGGGTDGPGSHLQQCREATGEGRRKISWIWRGVDTTDPGRSAFYAGIKVEYCKAYSRKKRWEEEVPLLREEMRRTLESLNFERVRWERIADGEPRDGPLGEGARAYASTQADTYCRLHTHFDALWKDLREEQEVSEGRVQELKDAEDAAENAEVERAEGDDDEVDDEGYDYELDEDGDGDNEF